jgi:hypothetical protein
MSASDFKDSFRHITARVDSLEVPLTAVKSSAELSESMIHGNASKPRGRTIGQASPKGEIKGLYRDLVTLGKALAAKPGPTGGTGSVLGSVFEITKSVGIGDQPVITTKYKRCRFLDWQEDYSANTEALEVTLPFSCMDITVDDGSGEFSIIPD